MYNPRALPIANLHQFGPSALLDGSCLTGEGGFNIHGGCVLNIGAFFLC